MLDVTKITKIPKIVDANLVVNQLNHHNFHNEELIKLYSDLRIMYDNENSNYYSSLINLEANPLECIKNELSTYTYIYSAVPYKEIQINCPYCEGKIRVNSYPYKIPFLIEHEVIYRSEFMWYSTMYEELFKINNFHPNYLAESQLYVINKLEEYRKFNYKVDTSYLCNSIKKLLPFI